MAIEYLKILDSTIKLFHYKVSVVGNSTKNLDYITNTYNVTTYCGGIENNIDAVSHITYAIIASPVHLLAEHLELLVNKNIRNILVEKPAGLNRNQLENINKIAKEKGIKIYVAYNRRFYNSVITAKKIIENDGGAVLFNMDISELLHTIDINKYTKDVLNNWLLANTSHVIDLAIYLCGIPIKINNLIKPGLEWNKNRNAIYAGCGITDKDCLFNYQGNWIGAGRWSLEIFTKNYTLKFCPLEELQIRFKGTVNYVPIKFPKLFVDNYKPGLCTLVRNFIFDDTDELLTLESHIQNMKVYDMFNE